MPPVNRSVPFSEGRKPLVRAAAFFTLGIALFAWLPPVSPLWGLVPSSLALALAILAASRERRCAAAAASALFFLFLGGLRYLEAGATEVCRPFPPGEGDAVVTGRVAATPELREGTLVFDLERARIRRMGRTWEVRGQVQVFLDEPQERYRAGDLLTARGRLAGIRGDRNHAWFPSPVDPGRRRLAGRLFVPSPFMVRPAGRGKSQSFPPLLERLRERMILFWDGRTSPAAPLLKALTTGQRAGLQKETREAFRRSGLAHLLAVSGLHLGFLSVFLYRLLRFSIAAIEPLALRWAAQPLAAALTVPTLILLYCLTGEQVSAGRAAVVAGLGLAGVTVGRRPDFLNLVACAALVMLLHDPLLLFSVSFQLSFSAASLLVMATPRIPRLPPGVENVPWCRKVLLAAAGLFCVSSLAAAGTAPALAFHFQRISLAGPLANLIAVPLAGFVVLPLAWLSALGASLCPPLGSVLGPAAEGAGSLLVATARLFSGLRWSSLTVPPPSPLTVLTLGALIAALAAPTTGSRRRRTLVISVAVLGLSVILHAAGPFRPMLRTVFFDVGQGEAALVMLPGGEVMLIDSGPAWEGWDAGRSIVAPALRREGVTRIDYLVISHFHPDHCGGLESILDEFPVREIWTASFGLQAAAPEIRARLERWEEEGGSFWLFGRGDRRDLQGGVTVRFVNPPAAPYGSGTVHGTLNDNSLAFLLRWREFRLLATGDIGAVPSLHVASLLGGIAGGAVLKVPHHGGRQGGTEALAAALGSPLAIVSVGRNGYGHPDPGTLAAFGGEGRVLRTDREGGIFLESDGRTFDAWTWRRTATGERGWARRFRWLVKGL